MLSEALPRLRNDEGGYVIKEMSNLGLEHREARIQSSWLTQAEFEDGSRTRSCYPTIC